MISTFNEYQYKYFEWLKNCMGEEVAFDPQERNHRFCEEALELLQACGYSKDAVLKMLEYVYSRQPSHRPNNEIGDVQGTLAALSSARGVNLGRISEEILIHNIARTPIIRKKHAEKKLREGTYENK